MEESRVIALRALPGRRRPRPPSLEDRARCGWVEASSAGEPPAAPLVALATLVYFDDETGYLQES